MDADPTDHMVRASPPQWDQISFLHAPEEGALESPRHRVVDEALTAATHAVDAQSRRAALDHLYTQLAQQAKQRGRRAVPKRPPCAAGTTD